MISALIIVAICYLAFGLLWVYIFGPVVVNHANNATGNRQQFEYIVISGFFALLFCWPVVIVPTTIRLIRNRAWKK